MAKFILLLSKQIYYRRYDRLFAIFFIAWTVSASVSPAWAEPEAEPAEDWAALSDEQLAAKMAAARTDLLELRQQRHQARQAIEANNEEARAIIHEMNELRRQLREKNAELEALLAEDDRFEEWGEAEMVRAEELRALEAELRERQ